MYKQYIKMYKKVVKVYKHVSTLAIKQCDSMPYTYFPLHTAPPGVPGVSLLLTEEISQVKR